MTAVGMKIPLIAAGTIFGPLNPVERRSQEVKAEEEQIDDGMKPVRFVLAVRDNEERDNGREAGGDV